VIAFRVWRPASAGLVVRVALVLVLALLGLRFWPHAPLQARFSASTGVWSADGELLRVTLSADDQYRLWVPLPEIAPALVEAFLLKEDRWFYWHPGVNPVAIGRAAFRTYSGGDRQGGSTLTMQLARLTYRLNTRTPAGKAKQIALALWLEMRYSKRELLETYLNVVPFGGNLQGVGAASLVYFGKTSDRVTLGEALTLAVIPQRPARRAGRTASEQNLLAARARLGHLWLARHGDNADDRRQVELPILAERQFPMPWQAPHFVDTVLVSNAPRDGAIRTTLDARLQRAVELQVQRYLKQRDDIGAGDAAALLVDTRDSSVKAWIGSTNYWKPGDGQVNGVLAKRSPGSTLKPFVYALALDQGVLHPRTMLRDAPTSFGPFAPENFDGRFFGPVTAEDALIRSRNVPAVWVASQLRQPGLYQFLQTAGIRDLKSESFYGLALPLGGGEVTMEEMARLYVMLANGGVSEPLRATPSTARGDQVRLLSPEAAFITRDMLRRNARPDDVGMRPLRSSWPVEWKTGTSWGFRDAWSAGIVGPYVLVVWIGHFNGQGNPAFIGVDAAAPMFFRIADALNLARADEPVPPRPAPPGVSRVAVCTGSGDLPNADCPHTVDTWYIPGKSPIRVSQLHRAVAIDTHTGLPVCPPYAASARFEVFEFWPSDMLELFRKAGMPRRTPPPMPACATDDATDPPRIASPLRNVTYALRGATPRDGISLNASVAADVRRLFWFDGNALIGTHDVGTDALMWKPTTPGMHLVRVIDDHGRSAERDVEVQFAN
jgi:penicillin-binding protein 1C